MTEHTAKEEEERKAWRAMLIPAVGSAAFFASMLVNMVKTHKEHGWPKKAFKKSDYLLMIVPFAILGLALHEEIFCED